MNCLTAEERPDAESWVREKLQNVSPGYVSLQDYEDAIALLGRIAAPTEVWLETPGPIGQAWLTQAAAHLTEKLDRQFRDRPVIRDGKAAAAYLQVFGEHLSAASTALKAAAERMKQKGDSVGANHAYQAHVRARQAALELGTE